MTTMPLFADTSAIHEFLKIADVSPQLLDGLIDFPHGLAELFSVHTELEMATGTGKLRIIFKPTNRLADLLIAIRAGNIDLGTIELISEIRHDKNTS